METELVRTGQGEGGFTPKEEETLRRAGEIIRAGGLVAFPTETVYGLGGDALNRESSRKIYAAKGRPSDNPLIVHISNLGDLEHIVSHVPEEAVKLAQSFWPGPLTMVLPKAAAVPYETTGGLDTVAVRMPSHPVARRLISYSGGYVAAPSANASGRPSPTIAAHVIEDMSGRIDMIIDGGEVGIGLESTIVDLTVSPPQILRPGYITGELLRQVLGPVETDRAILQADSTQVPRAPGMKYRHYAPRGELVIVEGTGQQVAAWINRQVAADHASGCRTGVITTGERRRLYQADVVKCVGSRQEEESIARNLYLVLREFDQEKIDRIYSESFGEGRLGGAIMNRLLKAAGHRTIEASKEWEQDT